MNTSKDNRVIRTPKLTRFRDAAPIKWYAIHSTKTSQWGSLRPLLVDRIMVGLPRKFHSFSPSLKNVPNLLISILLSDIADQFAYK